MASEFTCRHFELRIKLIMNSHHFVLHTFCKGTRYCGLILWTRPSLAHWAAWCILRRACQMVELAHNIGQKSAQMACNTVTVQWLLVRSVRNQNLAKLLCLHSSSGQAHHFISTRQQTSFTGGSLFHIHVLQPFLPDWNLSFKCLKYRLLFSYLACTLLFKQPRRCHYFLLNTLLK